MQKLTQGMQSRMKIASIVGARPQFIKLAPLSKKLRKHHYEIIIHTGQHYDSNMSKNIFDDLEIPKPDYNLNLGSGTHAYQTGQALMRLEELYNKERPEMVVVFGDTNATIAGALAAAKLNIPVAHVESGLRSFNETMPEETNRKLTDHCSELLFAPTETAMRNLETEGLAMNAFLTGDIMMDVLHHCIGKAEKHSTILERLGVNRSDYILLTLHRPYNVDNPQHLKRILTSVNEASQKVVFSVHPRTMKIIREFELEIGHNIVFLDPVTYLDFIWLERNASKIVTDSGGIQKEAYMQHVPCITVRPETEWVETVDAGWNILCDSGPELVNALNDFRPGSNHPAIFGEGDCTSMIVRHIEDFYLKNKKEIANRNFQEK